jgi:predicted membrane-bound mannosyltransferase
VTSAQKRDQGDQWRLGDEAGAPHQPDAQLPPPLPPPRDLSRERLEHPVHVVTVEHLAWFTVAIYTVLSRLLALGARPLDPIEAAHALYAFDVASPGIHAAASYDPAYAGWIHLLTAGLFTIAGANDFTTRLVFALSGLLLVGMTFQFRHYLGRAGALALATMLSLSPAITWYSRASATAIPAVAMTLVTLAAFIDLKAHPNARRAVILGLFSGLMIAADPIGLVTAVIFVAALIPFGLWDLATRKHVGLAIRVWLDRYGSLPAIVMAAALATCAISQLMVPGGWDFDRIGHGASLMLGNAARRDANHIELAARLMAGLRFYLPAMMLYEFLIAFSGLFGALAIITLRIRSRFATWCLIWMALSAAFWLWTPMHRADALLAMLLPAAIVGAIALDWIHQRDRWPLLSWPLTALALLTLYVGAVANFVWSIPDASEAPWARHANLFRGADATTQQAQLYARDAVAGISAADATVYFDGAVALPLRWYLRGLRVVPSADAAAVVVSTTSLAPSHASPSVAQQSPAAQLAVSYHFDYAEDWVPNFAIARTSQVIGFLLSGRIWGAITTDDATIVVRKSPLASPANTGNSP